MKTITYFCNICQLQTLEENVCMWANGQSEEPQREVSDLRYGFHSV